MRKIDIMYDGNVATLIQTALKSRTAYDKFPISYIEVRKLPYMDRPYIRMTSVDESGNDKWGWDYQLSENDLSRGVDELVIVLTDFWRDKIVEWSKKGTMENTIDISRNFRIKEVKFNGLATIVFWEDGTKTIVRCDPMDIFDPEKGIAMAVTKKFLGNNTGKYYDIFKKWIPTRRYMKKKKRICGCPDCVYSNCPYSQEPCYSCRNRSHFVQKGEKKE